MRDVIEINVKDFELRPNFKYIAKRMVEEKADCYVAHKQDVITLYKLFQRKNLKIWTQRIGESRWAIRIKEANENDNPFEALGRDYETTYGKLKERIVFFNEKREIVVRDKQEAQYIMQKYREYYPDKSVLYTLNKEKEAVVLKLKEEE